MCNHVAIRCTCVCVCGCVCRSVSVVYTDIQSCGQLKNGYHFTVAQWGMPSPHRLINTHTTVNLIPATIFFFAIVKNFPSWCKMTKIIVWCAFNVNKILIIILCEKFDHIKFANEIIANLLH